MSDIQQGFYWVRWSTHSTKWEVAQYLGGPVWMFCGSSKVRRPEVIGERIMPPAHLYSEEGCPGHVASENDAKVCGRCGTHIDSLRPPEPDEA